jgi:DNA-binding transcriptional regulator YiaG
MLNCNVGSPLPRGVRSGAAPAERGKRLHLRCADLAETMEPAGTAVSGAMISNWERGESLPKQDKLAAQAGVRQHPTSSQQG